MSIQSFTRSFTLLSIVALSAASAANASPWSSPKHAKQKIVHVSIRNDNEQILSIHAGAQHFSIGSHVTVKAGLIDGDVIILDTGTQTTPAGTRIITIVPELADATIVLK